MPGTPAWAMTVGGLKAVFDLETVVLRVELPEVAWQHWIEDVYWKPTHK